MPRTIGKLNSLKVARATEPGIYRDGGGLYLQITARGAKSWVYSFMLARRSREMGLGPTHTVSLAQARTLATDCRRQLLDGVDPIEARAAKRSAALVEAAATITFKDAAHGYIDAHKAGWRNAKHASQWEATLETYAYPVFGALPVHQIDVGPVMKVVEPIWATKPETASRLRGRIEAVLDWATARKYRLGENPARWRGHLDQLLPARSKVRRVKHHAALPYDELGAFVPALRLQDGIAARALEFLILTVARTGETIYARWPEINLDAKLWIVPAERMKAQKEHRVPLSDRAVEILREMAELRQSDYVFPGRDRSKPLSNMALLQLLHRMGRDDVTAHGFRSSFRDWTAERTSYPGEVAEMALAHAVGDKVEAAYRRGDLFEKRRRLMDDWARFCDMPPAANVVPLKASA
jgi:integrase